MYLQPDMQKISGEGLSMLLRGHSDRNVYVMRIVSHSIYWGPDHTADYWCSRWYGWGGRGIWWSCSRFVGSPWNIIFQQTTTIRESNHIITKTVWWIFSFLIQSNRDPNTRIAHVNSEFWCNVLVILPEEDQPVMEALADLGIAVDNDNIFCVGNGQKLWLCPIKECGRMYPRQSMLKVHILSHFNVRPYRVSIYALLDICNGNSWQMAWICVLFVLGSCNFIWQNCLYTGFIIFYSTFLTVMEFLFPVPSFKVFPHLMCNFSDPMLKKWLKDLLLLRKY